MFAYHKGCLAHVTGDFSVDPMAAVGTAVITHAHADHARSGHGRYVAHHDCVPILRTRLGADLQVLGLEYGERVNLGTAWDAAWVSLHPAGHIVGSAQVRVEYGGEVWVVSGDYKRDADPTCVPFEVVPCDTFVTEATFGMPVFSWSHTSDVAREIYRWWTEARERGSTAILFCYALGKAQRLLAELGKVTDTPVLTHGAVEKLVRVYRDMGVSMLATEPVSGLEKKDRGTGRLVLAPPSALGSPWMKRFSRYETGFASGWMAIRGNRRRRNYDRGFVLSDHADWQGIMDTVRQTGASRVFVGHGYADTVARHLLEQGVDAGGVESLGVDS